MTEKIIQIALVNYYRDKCKYWLFNSFLYKWESDFWIIRENGYTAEFEIKISRGDFKSDFKKTDRHMILDKGIHQTWVRNTKTGEKELRDHAVDHRPNKFYYVCPKLMLKTDEVPTYAGLVYIDEFNQFIVAKEAPFIHRERFTEYRILADKFFYKWINCIKQS